MNPIHPKLARGMLWCTECGRSQRVNSAQCLNTGWPECCGYTMTIDNPNERRKLAESARNQPQAENTE